VQSLLNYDRDAKIIAFICYVMGFLDCRLKVYFEIQGIAFKILIFRRKDSIRLVLFIISRSKQNL